MIWNFSVKNFFNHILKSTCSKYFIFACAQISNLKGNSEVGGKEVNGLHCVKSVHPRSFSGPYCPAFGLHTKRHSVSLHIQSRFGEIRTRKTPNTDTFHAMLAYKSVYGHAMNFKQSVPLTRDLVSLLVPKTIVIRNRNTIVKLRYWEKRFHTGIGRTGEWG